MEKEVRGVLFGYSSHETIEKREGVWFDVIWHQVNFAGHFVLSLFESGNG